MIDRNIYKELFTNIEKKYSVTEWIHNDYHIWPILRIRLFLKLLAKDEGNYFGNSEKKEKNKSIFNKVSSTYRSWRDYKKLHYKRVSKIYCGAPSHRVDLMGKSYNKYFDYLMDESDQEDHIQIEYKCSSKKGLYRPDRIFLFNNLDRLYRIRKKNIGNREANLYLRKLEFILKEFGYDISSMISSISKEVEVVDQSCFTFTRILQRIKPNEVWQLCYYSPVMFGLNIAAHRLQIPTTDLQHGPQGRHHLAYGSWISVPEKGYEALPNYFHNWDLSSTKDINEWASSTLKHEAICTGNPWIEGWKKGKFTSSNYEWPSKIVLYTLQPTGNPLNRYILELINKTKNKWNWWLRAHPRQQQEIPLIKEKLRGEGLNTWVNIDDATNLPLPEILVNTKVHLTKFSGCAIEAYTFEVPTILLDTRGQEVFSHYLHNSSLMRVNTSHSAINLYKEINEIL